ncbi:hypothetical protein Tco_0285428 [Tanacetum coccineum]
MRINYKLLPPSHWRPQKTARVRRHDDSRTLPDKAYLQPAHVRRTEYARERERSWSARSRGTYARHSPKRVLQQELSSALATYSQKMHQEKEKQDKLKAVKARLTFDDGSKRNSKTHEES